MIGIRSAERAMPGTQHAKQRPAFLNGAQPFNIGHVVPVEQTESLKHRADLCTSLSAFLQLLAQFSPFPRSLLKLSFCGVYQGRLLTKRGVDLL